MGRPLGDWFAARAARPSGGWWHRRPAPAQQETPAVRAATTCRRDSRTARLEAVLLVAREPLGSRKLAKFAGLADGTEARTLIRRLNDFFDEEGSAYRIEPVAGGFQLLTRPRFGVWLRRFHATAGESRLSGPALETLAIVAYRQPVLRTDIEAIRGVQCGEMLRQLMDRDLVKIVGRAGELGRPFLYGTTKHFLEVFGLGSLEDLPRADFFRSGGGAMAAANDPTSDADRAGNPNRQKPPSITGREEPAVRTALSLDPLSTEPMDELLARPGFPLGSRPVASDEDLDDEDLEEEEEDDEDEEDDDEEEGEEWEEVDDEEFDEEADDEEEWDEDEEDDEEWDEEEEEEDDEEDDWDDDEEDEEEEWEDEGEE